MYPHPALRQFVQSSDTSYNTHSKGSLSYSRANVFSDICPGTRLQDVNFEFHFEFAFHLM